MADRARPLSWPTAVGPTVALAGPPALAGISQRLVGGGGLAVEFWLQVTLCAIGAFVLFVVVRLERLPLGTIGVRRPASSTIVAAFALYALAFVLVPLVIRPLVAAVGQPGADAGVARIRTWPVWFRVFVAMTSGAVEETLYRGYAVERLVALTGRQWVAATLAIAAFAAAHIPFWGAEFALTADLAAGVVLVLFYLWRRELLANILAHSAALLVQLMAV